MVDFGERLLKSLIISFVAVFLVDLVVHFFFSAPFETASYFGFKFLVAFVVAYFTYPVLTKTVSALVFTSIFHIIYSGALIGGFLDINRAIIVFGITGFFPVGTIFFIVHGLGFLLGLFVAEKVIK